MRVLIGTRVNGAADACGGRLGPTGCVGQITLDVGNQRLAPAAVASIPR